MADRPDVEDHENGGGEFTGKVAYDFLQRLHPASGRSDHYDAVVAGMFRRLGYDVGHCKLVTTKRERIVHCRNNRRYGDTFPPTSKPFAVPLAEDGVSLLFMRGASRSRPPVQ
jgi:hypothetical protein